MSNLFSIKNGAVTTIENCEDEPIQIPGTIQPHGFIIAIDKKETVVFCSENVHEFLGFKVEDVLSKKWDNVLPDTFSGVIKQYLTLNEKNSKVPHVVLFNGNQFDCFLKKSGEYIILECVITKEHPYSVYDVLEHTSELAELINEDTNLKTLCQLITKKIQDITDYDRVMVYRFDSMYNGEVFAETVVNNHEPFLGLHYPHTDIPEQARKLYLTNMMRLIVDIDYKPIAVVTNNTKLAQPQELDMSTVNLRSVSPIHIEYLKNMGVKATFTISLLKEGKLWGLVACHHYSAKNLSYIKQTQAFLQTQILSSQLVVQETAEKYKLTKQLSKPLRSLTEHLAQNIDFKENYFEQLPGILQIARASGAVLIGLNKTYHNGITPNNKQVQALNKWLAKKGVNEYRTNKLATEYPKAKEFENIASGLLYYNIVTSSINIAVIFFRPSLNKVINWAGEPKIKTGIEKLTPRDSFATWKQLVEGESADWEIAEIDTVFQFIYSLQQHLFRLYLKQEEIRIKELNKKLLKANKELENINWISTHDLREPLRKIQMFASMVDKPINKVDLDNVERSVKRIQKAAERMQNLLDDLLKYSKMNTQESGFSSVDLNEVVEAANNSFEEDYESGVYRLEVDNLPKISGSFFQIQQLFVNLIGNSIKFKDPLRDQNITIKAKTTPKETIISYCDTGIGFSPELNEKVFTIFQKGHINKDLHGSGIGLSICKKVVENHNGEISASGREGKGACFTITLPLESINT